LILTLKIISFNQQLFEEIPKQLTFYTGQILKLILYLIILNKLN